MSSSPFSLSAFLGGGEQQQQLIQNNESLPIVGVNEGNFGYIEIFKLFLKKEIEI